MHPTSLHPAPSPGLVATATVVTGPGLGAARHGAPTIGQMDPIAELADRYWTFRHRTDALTALRRGDPTHLEEMEDLTVEGVEQRRAQLEGYAAQADALPPDTPHASDLRDLIVFSARAEAALRGLGDDVAWVNHEVGLHVLLLTFLPRFPLVTPDDGRRFVTKLRRTAHMIDGLTDRVVRRARQGVTPIRLAVTRTITDLEHQLATPLHRDPLVTRPAPERSSEREADRFREASAEVVGRRVRPAIARLRDALATRVLPVARPDDRPGLLHLPEGADAYRRMVWAHTSTDLDPDQIHQIGLEQVERLEQEYREVAGPLLGTTAVGEIYARLRDDPELHYRDGATLVADATAALRRAVEAAPSWFRRIPRSPCDAVETPRGALAFYRYDQVHRRGMFFFNTADPTSWGTFQLEAVTFHEGVPGHHFQIARAEEDHRLHPLQRRLYIAAFNEGWALYTERLADEMGLYSSELQRVGMLAADSMRACRLVVDTGMHALGWSRDRAITYMIAHTPLSRRTVEGEIDRYVANPGQALGYMIGRLEIERMRAETARRLGDRFDPAAFHETVLGAGTIPLPTLERRLGELGGAGPPLSGPGPDGS